MSKRSLTRLVLLAALGVGLLASGRAQAGMLPVSYSVIPDSGGQRYTYGILLQGDSTLQPGDYFTIYDFAGYIPGTEHAPDGWTFTSSNVGVTPTDVLPGDDPTVPNLTFTYVEGDYVQDNFWAYSIYGSSATDSFTAQTHRKVDGETDSNITTTRVPVPTPPGGGNEDTPEPATLTLLGLGLAGALGFRRLKKAA